MLPAWFKNRTYKKRLSAVEWFREIRWRQVLTYSVQVRKRRAPGTPPTPERDEMFLELLKRIPPVNSPMYRIPSRLHHPVSDLTIGEVFYFHSVIRDEDSLAIETKFDELVALVPQTSEELSNLFTLRGLSEQTCQFATTCDELLRLNGVDRLAGPLKPLLPALLPVFVNFANGVPITVDTRYDDGTIIEQFKAWLAKTRKSEGKRLRRRFIQNDFDNWEYYRIREIFDLDAWAVLSNLTVSDKVIADAVWPNAPDQFSPIDVLRTTARKMVSKVFTLDVVTRMHGQLSRELGENFLKQ